MSALTVKPNPQLMNAMSRAPNKMGTMPRQQMKNPNQQGIGQQMQNPNIPQMPMGRPQMQEPLMPPMQGGNPQMQNPLIPPMQQQPLIPQMRPEFIQKQPGQGGAMSFEQWQQSQQKPFVPYRS